VICWKDQLTTSPWDAPPWFSQVPEWRLAMERQMMFLTTVIRPPRSCQKTVACRVKSSAESSMGLGGDIEILRKTELQPKVGHTVAAILPQPLHHTFRT